ncbi:hypothetical protein ACH4U3_23580 [Streptomyces griseoruber]|uniref:hypothetical protein n=1 Tax=Streptomyces griseoruber TaxID=1943 RepID=UPI00378C614D
MSDGATLIDPSGIPHFIGDLSTLDTDVMLLTANAAQFRASGANVHTTFQGLSAVYRTPDAADLLSSTLPVRTKADGFADDLEKVASALSDYSAEVQPLIDRLATLKTEATAFVDSLSGDDDWRKDQDKVDRNNELWRDVNHTVAAFQAAERTCHNRITALVGGSKTTVDDGSHGEHMYGYRADDLDHAPQTPWGAPAEREYEGWDWLTHQAGQVWDGIWTDGVMATIHGVGTLFGADGADAAGEAWKGLAKLATASALTSATLGTWWLVPDDRLPSWLRDSRTAYKQTVKGFVAWDTWKTNPSRAAGAVGFNVLTLLGTEGTGAAASGAAKSSAAARALSAVGKVGRAIDPMTYAGKAGTFAFGKVGESFRVLKNLHSGTTLDLLERADALRSPEIPDNAIPYVDDATGTIVYLTDEGHLLNADGSLHQHADEAAHELSANDHSELNPAVQPHHPREPVGADAQASHGAGAARPDGHVPLRAGEGSGSWADRGQDGQASAHGEGGNAAHSSGTSGGSGGHDVPSGHEAPRPHTDPPSGTSPHGLADGHQTDPAHGHGPGHDDGGTPAEVGSHGGAQGGPPDIDPAAYTRNVDDVAHAPTGRMEPDQEAGVLQELSRAKMPEPDQQKVLHALRKDPYGAGVAELLSRGHLRDMEGYRKLLDMCKQGPTKTDRGMVPAAHMAMRLATDLQERGVGRVGVELDTETFDLDVYTRQADGSVDYGYQLKDVTNIQGIKNAVGKAAKQLNHPGIGHRVALLDVHQPMGDLTPRMFNEAEFRARNAGMTVLLRFTDGSLTVPPNGPTLP